MVNAKLRLLCLPELCKMAAHSPPALSPPTKSQSGKPPQTSHFGRSRLPEPPIWFSASHLCSICQILIDIDTNVCKIPLVNKISLSISIFVKSMLSPSIFLESSLLLFVKSADISTMDINIRYSINKSGENQVPVFCHLFYKHRSCWMDKLEASKMVDH